MSLHDLQERYLPGLEAELRAVVQARQQRHDELFGILKYHLGWVDASLQPASARYGKRVRPTLCLLSCEACGGDWEAALPAAAAVELLHDFSLIHDDIEDGDRTRRGRDTVWAVWGQARGINAGDAMFGLAHAALLRLGEKGVADSRIVQAVELLVRSELALTGGQHLDIGFEDRDDVTAQEYLAMIEDKTAALMACSCELGALVAGADEGTRAHLASFGSSLGLAFQMRDDILGVWGDPKSTGKPCSSDLARRKKSLLVVHGAEHSSDLRSLLAQDSLSQSEIDRARRLLEELGSRRYVEGVEEECHAQALASLERAGLEGVAAQALRELAHELLGRSH
jgi:geranylgeranyl diphosphate synthase type I